jgi:3-oxoacyl-[acyl-carrier protein] reductase
VSAAKSIVITGASAGIGAALTKAFAGDGHQLAICARRIDRMAQVAKGLPSVFYMGCDVTSEADVKRFFNEVRARARSVDVLIHCAGALGPIGPSTELESEAWFAVLRTHLLGAFLATKHVVPLMLAERRPRILLLAGGGAFDPMPRISAYGVAKAGIIRFMETLAVELEPSNIAVNALAPGFVPTEIFDALLHAGRERGGTLYDQVTTLFREWEESDITLPLTCARFLISDEAAGLTGKTISARFDPWDDPEFRISIDDIVASDLYTSGRINPSHLKGDVLAERLIRVVENRHPKRMPRGAKFG